MFTTDWEQFVKIFRLQVRDSDLLTITTDFDEIRIVQTLQQDLDSFCFVQNYHNCVPWRPFIDTVTVIL